MCLMSHEHTHDRACAQCGKPIPADRDRRALYCDKVCKRAFHNMSQVRGQEIMALLEAQRKHCNAKKGTPEYEMQRQARNEISRLLGDYLRQNKEIGRDPARVVKARQDEGVLVMDKRWKEAKPTLSAKPWFMEKRDEA